MNFLDKVMGKLPSEKVLEKSIDPRFKNLLTFIYVMRFIFFPLSLCIALSFFVLIAISMAANVCRYILDVLFAIFNDSSWLNLSWFGLTEEDYEQEIIKFSEVNNGN